ncbi:MAG: NHL repeat-containing protein [Bacillota bacterium]
MIELISVEIIGDTNQNYNYPSGICYDSKSDNFYIADMHNQRVCWFNNITSESGVLPNNIVTPAGEKKLERPLAVCVNESGTIYVADAGLNNIFYFSKAMNSFSPLTSKTQLESELKMPAGVTVDERNNVYTNDYFNNRICKIDIYGEISSLAKENSFSNIVKPFGVFYRKKKVYFADNGNNMVRFIDTETGIIHNIIPEKCGYDINAPIAVSVDAEDNIYVCEQRKIHIISKLTNRLYTILDKEIWKKAALRFGINYRICHVGSLVIPHKNTIYWIDTIKGLVYKVAFSLVED